MGLLATFDKIIYENSFAQCDTLFPEVYLPKVKANQNLVSKVSCFHYKVHIF